MKTIDLRSDTVTKPTPLMLQAMFEAQVGDDVYGEDPTVNALETKSAEMFGKEAALFCPSGTMANQIAIKVLTQPQDEVICSQLAHIYLYEGGGMFFNAGVSAKLIASDNGKLTAADVAENINPDDVHFPQTSLVALENTMNKGGGCCYSLEEIAEIALVARSFGLKMHLDGARVFNAIVKNKENSQRYGQYFDTISVCLSKGLGAPVGSMLVGSVADIRKARRVRKAFGGGMRQAGYLAAAGLYALENNISRLNDDHRRATILEQTLQNLSFVKKVVPVETNIVIVEFNPPTTAVYFSQYLKNNNILANPFGKNAVRMVTHLDFDDLMLEKTVETLQKYA